LSSALRYYRKGKDIPAGEEVLDRILGAARLTNTTMSC
jgi:hypothetical protein